MAVSADIQQQVYDLLSRASNLSFVSTDREAGTRLGLTPGQRVTAEVLLTLPNNQVQVQVGSERFNLDLPMTVRQGQSLEMTFVSADPRSTFAIARPMGVPQPVSLSDASRLLGLLVESEQIADPLLRSSLQSIGDMLRHSSGEAGVLANLMDEALTYGGPLREGGTATTASPGAVLQQGGRGLAPDQNPLSSFETNAAQILQNIARNSRVILAEAVNQPVVPLPLMPGEEVDAAVLGTLPGGRVFVQVAGTALELVLPRPIQTGEILRLTYISSLPKPLFALPRSAPDVTSSALSGAGRWLSALEQSGGGLSDQQTYVLERLNAVLKSLPPDSPAFTAIQDEAITYNAILPGRKPPEQPVQPDTAAAMTMTATPQVVLQTANGVVLNDDMAKLLNALIKGNRLALLEVLNQQIMSAGFTPGQQIKGEVLALLGGGRFMVQVAKQALEFSMPKGTKQGDLVNLFFITDEPRPTFLMARFGQPGDSRVSDTARWLSGFLGATASRMPTQAALGILGILLAEPPADASQAGKMLQQGLRESGLFYESHLARWFGGEYQIEDILREPQGRLSSPEVMLHDTGLAADKQAQTGMKNDLMEAMEALFKKAGTSQAHEGIADSRTLPVVREQLDTLQSGQIVFRGDLFPGQQMEWKVRERESRRNTADDQERSWDTEMRLDLPRLGAINAKLRLDGSRISIDLHVSDEASLDLLSVGRPALVEQLQAAGLDPGEIGVRHDAPRE
ncbi:MAG: flagellar hook-length control protein FliK [Pedobacter sp.]